MKISEKEFKAFVLKEVKKIALDEGWLTENDLKRLEKENKKIVVESNQKQQPKETSGTISEETKEAKNLAEELKRMKYILDFRNPLLGEIKKKI